MEKGKRLAIILFLSDVCNEGGAAMSKDWTEEELQTTSKAIKAVGHTFFVVDHLNQGVRLMQLSGSDRKMALKTFASSETQP